MLWKDSYKTGIDEIDRQNFDLINNIEAMMSPTDNETRLMQLDAFEELVKKYFEREQKLHKECHFYDAYWHRIVHKAYIKVLRRTKQDFVETMTTPEKEIIFRIKLFEFLKNHITRLDKSFARYYHKNIPCEDFVGYEKAYATAMV